ncbi:hypothetical protein ACFLTC_03815, partial [Chloroflexota bacterium]
KKLESSVEPIGVEHTFYRYEGQGWILSNADHCMRSEYSTWRMLPKDQRSKHMPEPSDGAAAARAVACIKLRKRA